MGMRRFAISASIVVSVLLLLLPIGSVWVGQFELTITIDSPLPIPASRCERIIAFNWI